MRCVPPITTYVLSSPVPWDFANRRAIMSMRANALIQRSRTVGQQVIVSTYESIDLKPLLEAAIRSELHMLDLSLDRTAERLRAFETHYGLTSEEFMRRFESGTLDESLDYIEWAGEMKTYQLLQTQQRALQSAHVQ